MMNRFLTLTAALSMFLAASAASEKIILLNEGIWQADNGKITYLEDDHIVSNQWFRDINKSKLGDTPNDIIKVNENLIAIAVNWSNIVQFIYPDGRAVAATEDIPNNRKLATDGDNIYVSSYGHECGIDGRYEEFTKGFVAKIDASTFKVTDACEVGYEPEGIAYYDGYLFVANTGGYAFQEDHEYETTISVIDAERMAVIRTVDVKQINLYGKMSQSGQYLCINSPGDYYEVPAATIILDCEAVVNGQPDSHCFVSLPYAATYNCVTRNGQFYAVGSRYSYITGEYAFNYITIAPEEVMASNGERGITEEFPGTLLEDMKNMSMPYGIYVNPYTGYIYATDAASFAEGGILYQWSPEGKLLGKYDTYINPSHFLALKPDNMATDIKYIPYIQPAHNTPVYDITGIPVTRLLPGNIYIQNGKKFIAK